MIGYDRIVLVDGRLDAQGAEPKVLVDTISTDLSMWASSDGTPAGSLEPTKSPEVEELEGESLYEEPEHDEPGGEEFQYPASHVVSGTDDWVGDTPPPPDLFPDDWGYSHYGTVPQDSGREGGGKILPAIGDTASVLTPASVPSTAHSPQAASNVTLDEPRELDPAVNLQHPVQEPAPASQVKQSVQQNQAGSISLDPTNHLESPDIQAQIPPELPVSPELAELVTNTQQYLVSPVQTGEVAVVHMITVVLRSTGDKTRDVLRMRRIHGTVMSFPGSDRFAFHVFEKGHGYLVEFPNFTTGLCPELLSKLKLLVGSENVRVEPITFQ
jgi:hypothetical protein